MHIYTHAHTHECRSFTKLMNSKVFIKHSRPGSLTEDYSVTVTCWQLETLCRKTSMAYPKIFL